MVLMINPMRILVRLVLNWKKFKIISRVLPPYLRTTVWMSHIVTRFWVPSWTSHYTYMNESCPTIHIWMSHVVGNIWMSHVSHMNESYLSCVWVMSLIWMSHVPQYIYEWVTSWEIYGWVMSLIWMSHISRVYESCLSYEWVGSLIWMSHISYMNVSCLSYEWVMSLM